MSDREPIGPSMPVGDGTETLAQWAQRQADAAPPMSDEQMRRVAALLRRPIPPGDREDRAD